MNIAFSGTHRVGKTTLARLLEEELNIEFRPMEISNWSVWTWSGIRPTDHITFSERLTLQHLLLDEMESILNRLQKECESGFITDRSPLDLLAYLLSNIDDTCGKMYDRAVINYMADCIELTRDYFDKVIVVPIFLGDFEKNIHSPKESIRKEGKVYSSLGYRYQIEMLIKGMAHDLSGIVEILPNDITNIHSRMNWITGRLGD